ncbi:MAG: hypothetical protein KIPDCIKN_01851 [Haliscomenobacter sp.]|nr:hypothetical protein [Haliscomenobacter sp.]
MFNKRVVFLSACLGLFLFGVGALTLGSIAPELRAKYALDDLEAGTLFSIFPIGILAGSLVFGPISDRFGYRFILLGSALMLAAGFAGLAFASGMGWLTTSVLLIGAGGGAINGATTAVVSDTSDPKDRSANLSLLGVSFGVGALGMPFLLGALKNVLPFEPIVTAIAGFSALVGIMYLAIRFPEPKQAQGFPLAKVPGLIRDPLLLLISGFLFFQSAFEAIINNWTTTFLESRVGASGSQALFGLTCYVFGMTTMRLLTGSVWRRVPPKTILFFSLGFILAGILTLQVSSSLIPAMSGLFLLGVGLAGGFPIMFGFVGSRFTELSGTAFSFVLLGALIGNMLINYLMGVVVQTFGVEYLPMAILTQWVFMTLLVWMIGRKVGSIDAAG